MELLGRVVQSAITLTRISQNFDLSFVTLQGGLHLLFGLVLSLNNLKVHNRAVNKGSNLYSNTCYYMASSASRQDEPNRAL